MVMAFAIDQVTALQRYANQPAALALLKQIAAQVLPLLSHYEFRVKQLAEFFPKNPHLLGMNVNRGAKILLRLRPASDCNRFLPYEALVETMVHELAHMRHGPHNTAFYEVGRPFGNYYGWLVVLVLVLVEMHQTDGLTGEWNQRLVPMQFMNELKQATESLMMRNLTGDEAVKFFGAGQGHKITSLRPSPIPCRFDHDNRAAVLAAERRRQYQQLLGATTSVVLQGSASGAALSAEELRRRVAEAAERRRIDALQCAVVLQPARTQLDEQSTPVVVEETSPKRKVKAQAQARTTGNDRGWQCASCTLTNSTRDTACRICLSPPTVAKAAIVDLTNDPEELDHNDNTQVPAIRSIKRARTNAPVIREQAIVDLCSDDDDPDQHHNGTQRFRVE